MNTIESIADDGIEHARYCTEQSRWLNAVAAAIGDTLEGGRGSLEARVSHAKDLAGLAGYLAYDLINYSDRRASEMQKELEAVQAQGGAE